MVHPSKRNIIVILGPTAVGKTDLALEISKFLDVEILSADSRQLYKYLDIGTAKPSEEMLRKVPHHFINILKPDQDYSAGRFGEEGRKKIEEIFERNKTPLVVGGSGLYIKALLEGFFEGEIRNDRIRKSLQVRLKREGPLTLYRELSAVDPKISQKLHPHNGKQIIRALEVYMSTGERLSDLQKNKLPAPHFNSLKFGLMQERSILYERINQRVEKMFQNGLVGEVTNILEMGYDESLNSLNTVGYAEVIQYLNGNLDYKSCVEKIKQNSRHYAKRQSTWFRADKEIHWFNIEDPQELGKIAGQIITIFKNSGNPKKN